jgi:transposase
MFFREKRSRKSVVLQLVESHRNGRGKVRQRVVVSLGGLVVPDEYRKAVAHEVSQRMAGYQRLIEDDPVVAYWTQAVIAKIEDEGKLPAVTCREVEVDGKRVAESVRVDAIEHERSTLLGPLLVLDQAWRSLGLDEFFSSRKTPASRVAAAKMLVFNRLIDPCSENELLNWIQTTSFGDLTGYAIEGWGEDRFYRVGDKLLSARKNLERHLRERARDLFNLDRTILLYDLTNSYFEGEAEKNELAKRSANSKEKRSDCPLISVGVVLDAAGFIITHKVFAGNVGDCKTLMKAVADLETIAGSGRRPVVVVDGGVATKENLGALRQNGYDYVVNGKRQTRAEFAEDFAQLDQFKKIEGRGVVGEKRPVFVHRVEKDGEIIVLCRSEGRREKETAIRDNAERKLVEGLEKLSARIQREDSRLKLSEGPAMVNRAIGSLVKRSTRASKFYEIRYNHQDKTLAWLRREEDWDEAGELHGCYHLRSSIELPDDELWKLYITLTKVEAAFRHMKSGLGLRPFHHQLRRRCEAHVWITILAYHLLRWVEYSLEMGGYAATWKTISRVLTTHCYATILAPTEAGLVYHVRKPGKPDARQKLVYEILGIDHTSLPIRRRVYKTK